MSNKTASLSFYKQPRPRQTRHLGQNVRLSASDVPIETGVQCGHATFIDVGKTSASSLGERRTPLPFHFNALARRYGNALEPLYFNSLSYFQRVVHLNAEITHCALHF
jgi:hypothetical protein